VTPEQVAELLAERLSEVVPSGFRVVADGSTLMYNADFAGARSAGTDIRANFRDDSPVAERIRWVSELALGDLQDFVDEMTARPWPGERKPPLAHAEVRGSAIHLWYGEVESLVLRCRPIYVG